MASENDVVGLIKNCWANSSTGALFLKLENNQLLQLFFVKGVIQCIKYQGLNGSSALEKITSLGVLKYQFHEGAISKTVNDLPPMEVIFDQLSSSDSSFLSASHYDFIDARTSSLILEKLTHYLGPIADLIIAEQLDDSTTMEEYLTGLYEQIDDPEILEKFKDDIALLLDNSTE